MKPLVLSCSFMLVLAFAGPGALHAGSATWSANPPTGDWNTATNWAPNTVPNGPSDTASFNNSSATAVTLSRKTTVNGIVFNPGASAFAVRTAPAQSLTISGSGIVNNSGVTQNFVTADTDSTLAQDIVFTGNASAGSATLFTSYGSAGEGRGRVRFFDSATAAEATFINIGLPVQGVGGRTEFHDTSTAGNASFTNQSGGNPGGTTEFYDSSTAGTGTYTTLAGVFGGGFVKFNNTSSAANGTFITNGAAANEESFGGDVFFFDSSTADHGTFIINGAISGGAGGGALTFEDSSTAGNATLTVNGPTVAGGAGGHIAFTGESTAGAATIVINGGVGVGGSCGFGDNALGGTARVEVFGNGTFTNGSGFAKPVTVGSIEGDGNVIIEQFENLVVGSSNLSTLFSGVISDLGSLTKIGDGALTLTGDNTYSGRTTVIGGKLVVSNGVGSGTGSGTVQVNVGTLGGCGTISGSVTVGTGSGAGALLAPAAGARKQATLTIQSALTLNADATYTCTFKAKQSKGLSDQVAAKGVTIKSGATIALSGQTKGRLRAGLKLTLLSNTSANPISGTFSNLPEGAVVTISGNNLQASYTGGDGNDLTLTVQ